MTWVKRAPVAIKHRCDPPSKQIAVAPAGYTEPDASFGDLWRCDLCGVLWQVVYRWPPRSLHPVGMEWKPASWWQRFRNRKAVDLPESPPPIKGGPVD